MINLIVVAESVAVVAYCDIVAIKISVVVDYCCYYNDYDADDHVYSNYYYDYYDNNCFDADYYVLMIY